MIEASGYGALLTAANWSYWVVSGLVTWAAWWLPVSRRNKFAASAAVALLCVSLSSVRVYQYASHKRDYNEAKALFDRRCSTAGERVHRSVESVEGITLLGVRKPIQNGEKSSATWLGAGFPDEANGDDYIRSFLYWEHANNSTQRGFLNSDSENSTSPGYRYVEVKTENSFYRYFLKKPPSADLTSEPIHGPTALYVVEISNDIDINDRRYWVAGTKIRIIHASTGEILGERQSYAFEPGLGDTSGFRNAWSFAITCPNLIGWEKKYPTRFFVNRVLKPVQKDEK